MNKLSWIGFIFMFLFLLACQDADDMLMVMEPEDTDTMVVDTMSMDTMILDTMSLDTMVIDTMGVDSTGMDTTLLQRVSYLALGDSYTVGQGVLEEVSFPFQLRDSLLEEDIVLDPLQVIARTGWRTDNLLDAIVADQPGSYDVVSLLIGVNNQFQNQSYFTFQAEFDSLLAIAVDLAGSKDAVFVVSIPDYGVTPFGSSNSANIAEALDNYNAFMKGQCDVLEIPFIDITTISRQLGDGENALASDNLHPSGYQYSLWAQEILPTIRSIIEAL